MKTMNIGDLKTNFSETLKEVKNGEKIAIAYGKKKEIIAFIIPNEAKKPKKRKLGILEGKGKVIFADDFKMTEEEFLGL